MNAHEGVKKSSQIDWRTMKELVECVSIMHAWKFLKKSELKFVSFVFNFYTCCSFFDKHSLDLL